MAIIPNLFGESAKKDMVVPNLFGEEKPKSLVVPNLFGKEQYKESSFLQEAFVKPVKTFYGGVLKAGANTADTLDFYSDKIAKTLNIPETKNSIFEWLRDNWDTVGTRLQKEGLSKGVAQKIYSGLGEAGWEVPKLMILGPEGLVISGAAEGGKTGGAKGAVVGGATGALFKGTLKGLGTLPAKAKYPVAFGVGAVTTPGDLEEKVAGGAVLTGLSIGKSPSAREFKEAQLKSPLVKGYQRILPFETRERIYQDYVNRFQSIENVVQKARNLGADIISGENPALRARGYLGIGRKVQTVLEDKTYRITPEGRIEITGEGLKPILDSYDQRSPIKGRDIREKDLQDYEVARRIILDLQRPKSEFTTEQIVTPEQIKKAQSDLNRLNQKYGNDIKILEDTNNRHTAYEQRILHLLVDSGNMSQKQYDNIITKNPHHVSFERILEDIEPTGGTPISKRRFTGARSPIKKIKGSELEIHNTVESTIKSTYKIMDIAERNTVAKGVAKLREVLPSDISPVEVKMVPVATVEHKAAIDTGFQNQLVNFAKTLGAKFKTTGQIGRQLGVYYGGRKEITRKFATPREVLSHETAHFFDDKFGLKQKFYKRGESKVVTEELIGLMQRMGEKPYRIGKPEERFADGFEWWLTHRDLAKRDLPLFSKEMKKIIEDIPSLKPILKIEPQPAISVETMQETIFRPSQFKPKGNIIEYFENGKRKYIEVSDNLYQAMSGLNETSLGLMTKIMSKPAHWLRVGATITPEFMIRNPIRDQLTALIQTKMGFRPFIDSTGAIADVMGKSKSYYDWLRSGGAYAGFVELSRPQLKQALRELQRRPSLLKNLNIINKAQDLSQLFEQATRLAVYKRGVKKGLTPVEAGFESREATVDFARRGSQTKDVNAVIAFFNAGIQGTDKSIRTAMADPAGFTAKAIASITIPSLLLYLKNRNDPDYKELPRWQKDLFWITRIGETHIRIPKPFLYGQIFGSIPERFFEYLETEDKEAFNKLEKSLYDAVLPVSGDPATGILATGLKPIIENASNWSFFRERPIVPEGKERLLPQEQYTKYTTETAKMAGEILKYPPAKIENLLQGWFGGTGKYALEAGDMLIKGIRKSSGQKIEHERPTELADIPLIKGFVTRPVYGQSESIQQFYEDTNKINQAYATYMKLLKEGKKEKALKIKEQYGEWKYAPVLNLYSKRLSMYNQQIERIVKSEKLEQEKRKLINEIEKRKTELAQKANKLIKEKRMKSLIVPNLFD